MFVYRAVIKNTAAGFIKRIVTAGVSLEFGGVLDYVRSM